MLPDEYDDGFGATPDRPTPSRHRLPPRLAGSLHDRRARWAAVTLTCLAVGGLLVHAALGQHGAASTATTARSLPMPAPAPLVRMGKSWPSTGASCGTDRFLPIVTADPLRVPTGVRIEVGGQTVHTVDVDARSVSSPETVNLPANEFVSQLVVSGGASYALVQPCESTDTGAVFRVTAQGSALLLASNRHIDGLFPDGHGGVWAAEVADIATDGPVVLVQLPGSGVVRLPAGLQPVAVSGHRVIAMTQNSAESHGSASGSLVTYDLTSRRLGPSLGRASSLTASAGVLLWTEGPCSAAAPCILHRYDLATGASSVRGYSLPVEASVTGGVISPDRRRLAFALPREFDDRHVDTAGFGPPLDLVMLDLGTGVLEGIPGVELPPTAPAGLTFSADSAWLVIALNEGASTRLLLWRPGLSRPLRAGVEVAGPMLQAPPVVPAP